MTHVEVKVCSHCNFGNDIGELNCTRCGARLEGVRIYRYDPDSPIISGPGTMTRQAITKVLSLSPGWIEFDIEYTDNNQVDVTVTAPEGIRIECEDGDDTIFVCIDPDHPQKPGKIIQEAVDCENVTQLAPTQGSPDMELTQLASHSRNVTQVVGASDVVVNGQHVLISGLSAGDKYIVYVRCPRTVKVR